MATKLKLEVLPQETLFVDDIEYLATAMPATPGLQFMEKYQEDLDKGKNDLSVMKQVICKYITVDNDVITEKRFDVIFARKLKHLSNLYSAYIRWNFEDVFTAPDSEE